MNYETLLVEKWEDTVTVTFNRPVKLNAINHQLRLDLENLLSALREDITTKFVIFTGAGRAFSSGMDVDEFREFPGKPVPVATARLGQFWGHDMMRNLESLEQVTIAAINGYALGAGLSICMACDFRLASEKAILGIVEARVGGFFSWGCTPRLTRLIGPAKAKEMIMTCDTVDANEALRIGLVNKVVPPDRLMDAARELARKIGMMPPLVTRLTKKLVNAASAPSMGDIFICEPELVERLFISANRKEAVDAFLEKREPRFTKE